MFLFGVPGVASAVGMEKGTSHDRYFSEGAPESDEEEGSAVVGVNNDFDYHRLIEEQRFELEELKRAARQASPSNK